MILGNISAFEEVGRSLAEHLILRLQLSDPLERLGHVLAFIRVGGGCPSMGVEPCIAGSGLQGGPGNAEGLCDLLLLCP